MLNMKKTAVAVLALSSSVAFAGTMGPVCSATNVTVPCERSAWDIGITALYLQANTSDRAAFYGSTLDSAGNETWVSNNPRYNWGFKLEGSYHFNTGNDFNVNWYHLGNSSKTRTVGTGYAHEGTFVALGGTTVAYKPYWDAVNLELGQHVDFGQNVNVRFHGGGQFARTRIQTAAYLTNVTTTGVVAGANNLSFAHSSTFSGFGPRFGLDPSYDWGNGFSVRGSFAAAVLVGSSKFADVLRPTVATALLPNRTRTGSRTQVVPELEGKLGAAYTYAMAQGDLTLDAGWMWADYIHAVQFQYFNEVAGNSGDFSVQGPYIGLKWVGSVA